MKYILMMIIFGHGYSSVPVTHSIELDNQLACETAKKIVIADWQDAHIAYQEKKETVEGFKKSDRYEITVRNYSVTCFPAR